MDPDAALAQIRATVEAMVTLWDGLDSWLSRGGFLPASWRRQDS
jgi:hypothetical protein